MHPDDHQFPPLQNDRFLRAARGEPVDRVPVWIMRQAGRYLPEFMAVRREHEFFEVCRTPELACEITMQPIRRFDLDAAIIFSDILVIPQAMGMEVQMLPTKGPHFPAPLKTEQDLDALVTDLDKVRKELTYVMDAITLTRKTLGGKVPLLGFSGAPWTLMAYMVEGGGSKSFDKAKRWLYSKPASSHKLLQHLADIISDYLVNQIRAGAQGVQLFDSWAGELTPELWRTFAAPYVRQIAANVRSAVQQMGIYVPIIIFSKGNAWYSLDELRSMQFDVIGIDYTMDAAVARATCGAQQTLQGNMDPCVLFSDDSAVIKGHVRKMLEQLGTEHYIANLGHGLLPDHNPDNVKVFIDAVHEISEEMIANKQKQQQENR